LANKITGEISLPGDKSISHRAALFSAFINEKSEFHNFNLNLDCRATLQCLNTFGIKFNVKHSVLTVEGRLLKNWVRPLGALNAGNSGTTARIISGILSNLHFAVNLTGDSSLKKRPMERIIEPLKQMGAQLNSQNGFLPLEFKPVKHLDGIKYELPVASAQVKSAVLLAGLFAAGHTEVVEFKTSRDHTERLLGLPARQNPDGSLSLFSSPKIDVPNISMTIPGDFSSSAFFIAAALMLPGSELTIRNVSLNPTRTGFLDVLNKMGAKIEVEETASEPEPAGDLHVVYSQLQNITIDEHIIPNIIDEIPILAVLAAKADGTFTLKGASELRHKESDRLHAVAVNLKAAGVDVEELPDGLIIEGGQEFKGGRAVTFGDHRIAMSFAIAGLTSREEIVLDDPGCADVSFPEFWDMLEQIVV